MLGIRRYHNSLVIDPCLDKRFNQVTLDYLFDDYQLHITYHIENEGKEVEKIVLNGKIVKDKVKANHYKKSVFVIERSLLKSENDIEIYIK